MDVFSSDIIAKAHELDDGDGVLVLVDFVGGTPANITGKLLMNEPNMEGLSGVNFPMILEAVNSRDDSTLNELKEQDVYKRQGSRPYGTCIPVQCIR